MIEEVRHLLTLLDDGDVRSFAEKLGLDPAQTEKWAEDGFLDYGYGATVRNAVGAFVVTQIRENAKVGAGQTPRHSSR